MDVEGGWKGRSVWRSQAWDGRQRNDCSLVINCKMMKGIIDLISRGSMHHSEPAKQMLWSTAGCLETTQTFSSGRWRPTTFRRSPRPVSWVWRQQTGRSRVKQPNHQLRTIWTSAMMSCVRALTSRSVKHNFWTPEKVFFLFEHALKNNPKQTASCSFTVISAAPAIHSVLDKSGSFLSYISTSEVYSLISLSLLFIWSTFPHCGCILQPHVLI